MFYNYTGCPKKCFPVIGLGWNMGAIFWDTLYTMYPNCYRVLPVRWVLWTLEAQETLLSLSTLLPTALVRRGTCVETRVKYHTHWTCLFVSNACNITTLASPSSWWNRSLLPSLQSQKFWHEIFAGQAKKPLALVQFTDGWGSSVIINSQWIKIYFRKFQRFQKNF